MAEPIRIIGTDLKPLVIDDDYEVIDKQLLAEWIAEIVLGHYYHIFMIIEHLAPDEIPSENAQIDAMIAKLNVDPNNDTQVEHRDGWLFQMISWIALNIGLHSQYDADRIRMVAPHDAPAKHGIDGLALVLTHDDRIEKIVITEDKCTTGPQNYIRYRVLPEFKIFEDRVEDNKLISELTNLLSPQNNLNLYISLSPSFARPEYRCYRIGITREDKHNSNDGRKALFEKYDDYVSGDVSRRHGASVYLNQVRLWMKDLSDRVVAVLQSKKQ